MKDYKVEFSKIEWEVPYPGIKHKIVAHNGVKLRLVEYSREMPVHWCSKGHIGMILDGEMEIEFSHETLVYKKNDGVFIPNGEAHRHRATVITATATAIFVELDLR